MNKQNKNDSYTQNVLTVARGEGFGDMGENGERIVKYKLAQNSHGDVKHSIGNIVNNIAKTMYSKCDIYQDDHLVMSNL